MSDCVRVRLRVCLRVCLCGQVGPVMDGGGRLRARSWKLNVRSASGGLEIDLWRIQRVLEENASGDAAGVTMDEYAATIGAALQVAGGVAATTTVPMDAHGLRNYEKQGVVDTSKAERELGFRPSPLDTFVQETVAWHIPLLT